MYSIIFGTDIDQDFSENPWLCIYNKYREVFRSSVEKMTGMNLKEIFQSPWAQEVDFNSIVEKLKKIKYENGTEINRIIERCIELCPPKEIFKVYFLPVPFDSMIMTNHSPEIGTFILYGVGKSFHTDYLKIYLPHEYAHIVRLQEVLLKDNIDSPHKMTLGELAIFEGLGVAFSMIFNGDVSESNIPKYVGPISQQLFSQRNALIDEFWRLYNRKIPELSREIIEKYYGEKSKGIYIVGTSLILKLISNGYSICNLNRMIYKKIINLVKSLKDKNPI